VAAKKERRSHKTATLKKSNFLGSHHSGWQIFII